MFVKLIEVVKDVEKFFLGFFFINNKLKIINNETVKFLEFAIKFFAFAVLDSINEVGVEVGDGGVEDFVVGVVF